MIFSDFLVTILGNAVLRHVDWPSDVSENHAQVHGLPELRVRTVILPHALTPSHDEYFPILVPLGKDQRLSLDVSVDCPGANRT